MNGPPQPPAQRRPEGSISALTRRYHIESKPAPELVPHPSRFRVHVKKWRLVRMVLRELFELEGKGRFQVALSRPCVYGVFGRPVGGLAPRHDLCVGCLRCTTQYPEVVQIHPNPERLRLGDSYIIPDYVDTIVYESRTGRVPVRGAGYRGMFGGAGWDGMWTDMSEIVRPTRDGIHGREYISTTVDIGEKPPFLRFDEHGEPVGPLPRLFSIQVPFLFDLPPAGTFSRALFTILTAAAERMDCLAVLPLEPVVQLSLSGPQVVPLVSPDEKALLDRLTWQPRLVELNGWNKTAFEQLSSRLPESLVAVRVPTDADVLSLVSQGVRIVHLAANYHGVINGRFAMDVIREVHEKLVQAGMREEVTLLGGGGIVMAEHVPKAIICGLDAVTLDTALCVALQARFAGECTDRETASIAFPRLNVAWGIQRLQNLASSWRDQLLEILGAMGLREVRRLRGELGRCMFQKDLEREAFGGIEGYGATG